MPCPSTRMNLSSSIGADFARADHAIVTMLSSANPRAHQRSTMLHESPRPAHRFIDRSRQPSTQQPLRASDRASQLAASSVNHPPSGVPITVPRFAESPLACVNVFACVMSRTSQMTKMTSRFKTASDRESRIANCGWCDDPNSQSTIRNPQSLGFEIRSRPGSAVSRSTWSNSRPPRFATLPRSSNTRFYCATSATRCFTMR